jgi:hypothetical protein
MPLGWTEIVKIVQNGKIENIAYSVRPVCEQTTGKNILLPTPFRTGKRQNSTFKQGYGNIMNLETSADVIIRRLSWNLQ